MRTFLIALMALTLSPSLAVAGGSKLGTLLIQNDNSARASTDLLAVLVDADPSVFEEGDFTIAEFFAAGGRLIGPKGVTSYGDLKLGAHTVFVAYIPVSRVGALNLNNLQTSSATVNVQKGVTFVHVRGSANGGATISTSSSPVK